MCSGSEAGSYLRLIDFVYHSTLGVRVLKKKETRVKPYGRASQPAWVRDHFQELILSTSSLLLSSLELSDTKVYEPQIRALLGTASLFCEVVVLKLPGPLQDSQAHIR